jgi:hypothetical protein
LEIPDKKRFLRSVNEYETVIIGALTGCSHDFYGQVLLFNGGENVDSAGFHRWAGAFGMPTLLLFYIALPAERAGAGTKAESLPGSTQKDGPL